ncbi:LPXTG cell wall anchor domain-containing protein [Bacillus sp. JCM 19041]
MTWFAWVMAGVLAAAGGFFGIRKVRSNA